MLAHSIEGGSWCIAVELGHPTSIPLQFVAVWQMAADRQSDKVVPDMEVYEAKVCH